MDGYETTPAPVEADQSVESPGAPPEGTSATDASEDLFSPAPELNDGSEWTAERLMERHRQMQADYTRKTQEVAELRNRGEDLEFLDALRSDPEVQQAVFEQLKELLGAGTEAEDDVVGDVSGTEESALERQVRELREAQEARDAQETTRRIVDHLDQLAGQENIELSERELRQVFEAATANGVGPKQTEAAFKAHVEYVRGVEKRAVERYLASKRAPQQVPAGTTAKDTPALSNRDERIRHMAAIIEKA